MDSFHLHLSVQVNPTQIALIVLPALPDIQLLLVAEVADSSDHLSVYPVLLPSPYRGRIIDGTLASSYI